MVLRRQDSSDEPHKSEKIAVVRSLVLICTVRRDKEGKRLVKLDHQNCDPGLRCHAMRRRAMPIHILITFYVRKRTPEL